MARADAGTRTPHLFSTLIACALTAAILGAGRMLAVHLEHSTLPAIASEAFPLKNQGLAFQRAAARATAAQNHRRSSRRHTPPVVQTFASRFLRHQALTCPRPLESAKIG